MLKVQQLAAQDTNQHFEDVTFAVEPGESVAIIGPEWSGKQLLGAVLAGSAMSQTGTISINHYHHGHQPVQVSRQIGYLPSQLTLPSALTAFEYLDLVGSIYHLAPTERLSRIKALTKALDFDDSAYSLLENASLAAQQKVGLAAGLIHQPDVVILDEPLQYLDFAGQTRATQLIQAAKKDGAAMVLITDNLVLAESWADQFIVLNEGTVAASGTLKQLINQTKPKSHDLVGVYSAIFSL